jgi:hypothetical protein
MAFFEPELENMTNAINQYTHARPVDAETLATLKTNFER